MGSKEKPMREPWRGRRQGRSEGRGSQFKRARLMFGFTQKSMASRLGCSITYIGDVELGNRESEEIYKNRLLDMIRRFGPKMVSLHSLDDF
jgi:transcriptional regulator with XRE-family HTH domain